MPPLPQATDEAFPDESWPIWEHANTMPSLEDDGNKTLATQNQKNPGVGGPTFNKLLAARDGEDVGMEISTESDETHSYAEGTKVIFKGLTALQYNGQVGKILKKLGDIINTGQDTGGFDERAQAWRENHKSGDCSDSPVIIFPKNHAGRTQYTRTTDYEHLRDQQRGGGPIGRHSIGGR